MPTSILLFKLNFDLVEAFIEMDKYIEDGTAYIYEDEIEGALANMQKAQNLLKVRKIICG